MALHLAQQNALELESFPKNLYVIFQDVLALSFNFDQISFHFIFREKNGCAYAYAKSALNYALIVPTYVSV
uniref:T24P13.24 n=1 Tax=Arabidopsis thaliana TaxID=3702 RepID=Q9LQW8_ARATH|nr:T24P13.24 [Arabidopsis thaliana]